MICPETGYTDEATCECRPCPHCEGEGEIVANVPTGYTASGLPTEKQIAYVCVDCRGTGQDRDDCAIHDSRIALERQAWPEELTPRKPATVPALYAFGAPARKAASYAAIGNGLYVRTGGRK